METLLSDSVCFQRAHSSVKRLLRKLLNVGLASDIVQNRIVPCLF